MNGTALAQGVVAPGGVVASGGVVLVEQRRAGGPPARTGGGVITVNDNPARVGSVITLVEPIHWDYATSHFTGWRVVNAYTSEVAWISSEEPTLTIDFTMHHCDVTWFDEVTNPYGTNLEFTNIAVEPGPIDLTPRTDFDPSQSAWDVCQEGVTYEVPPIEWMNSPIAGAYEFYLNSTLQPNDTNTSFTPPTGSAGQEFTFRAYANNEVGTGYSQFSIPSTVQPPP